MEASVAYTWMVQIHCVKASILMVKYHPIGLCMFVYLDATKSTQNLRPNGRSLNGRYKLMVNQFIF